MRSSALDEEDEAPLDPVLLRVQARLRRLMIIGGLTLFIGILAVLLAIIYRFFIRDSGETVPPPQSGTIVVGEVTAEAVGLPSTAELLTMTLDGDRMALAFRDGADTVTVLIDTGTMAVVGQFRVTGGQ